MGTTLGYSGKTCGNENKLYNLKDERRQTYGMSPLKLLLLFVGTIIAIPLSLEVSMEESCLIQISYVEKSTRIE